MPDDYQYSVKPLPKPSQIGENATSASQISADPPTNFPFGSDSQLESPFNNSGSGGGGGGSPTCDTAWSIGAILSSLLQMPCTGGVNLEMTASGLQITSGSKVLTIQLDGSSNQMFIATSTKSVTINPDSLTDDGPDATFHELDVCHMGAAGKRSFLSSDAYAA